VNRFGGAIYVERLNTVILYVIGCTFDNVSVSCASSDYWGGAIYISTIGTLCLTHSVFKNTTGSGCGAAFIFNIRNCVLVHNCSVTECLAKQVGGFELGNYIIDANTDCVNHSTYGTIFGCLFKECKAGTYAGGLYIWNPHSSGSVRSCVFELCTATSNGGGIFLGSMNNVQDQEFLFYCFFNGNECGTDEWKYGADVYIASNYFTASSLVCCYTTAEITDTSNRCVQYHNTGGSWAYTEHNDWLHEATHLFPQYVNDGNENAVDSYGCGIHPSFPCKTTEWLNNHFLLGEFAVIPLDITTFRNDVIFLCNFGDGEYFCGTSAKPCDSLNTGLSHFSKNNNGKTLSIITEFTIKLEFSPSSDLSSIPYLTIKSNEANKRKFSIQSQLWNHPLVVQILFYLLLLLYCLSLIVLSLFLLLSLLYVILSLLSLPALSLSLFFFIFIFSSLFKF
jgi:hypothetical protein